MDREAPRRVHRVMPPLPPLPPHAFASGSTTPIVVTSGSSPGAGHWTPKSAPATLRGTGGGGGLDDAAPACPQCRHARHVHKFRFWATRGAWVWLCSAEPVGAHGQGTGFCGTLFLEAGDATCSTCRQRLRIESHAGQLGFYCVACRLFT